LTSDTDIASADFSFQDYNESGVCHINLKSKMAYARNYFVDHYALAQQKANPLNR